LENKQTTAALHATRAVLEMKIQALEMKIEALETKFDVLNELKDILNSSAAAGISMQRSASTVTEKKEKKQLGKKDAEIKGAIEEQFRKLFKNDNFSKPTYEATSSLMLCMLKNKTADAKLLLEYVDATGVTVSRYTRLLREKGLLSFKGSKRKGTYSLTPKGEKFLAKVGA
jgi:predicted transcriptional regulator